MTFLDSMLSMAQMNTQQRQILITAALPYANSDLHIGHLVEHFQVDFWCRFQNLIGNRCYFVCADDTHGTPIMIAAQKQGISPEEHIQKVWQSHVKDFQDFQVHHDHYSSTNSSTNRELCEEFYQELKKSNHFTNKSIEQLYCEHDRMFLPDRYVKGTCPKCGAADQYGDSCDKCGATYATTDLKNPQCAICGRKPVLKSSEHILFQLNDFKEFLEGWIPQHTQKEVGNKMMEWFNEPLRDWDITRDDPYFGFKIPGFEDKYFYVWVDAPMGYVSGTKELCSKLKLDFDEFWKKKDSPIELYHMIGKDIVYFHILFWPSFLKGAGFRTPNQVFVHGFLTVNGEKMSKSKGTQILARHYLDLLDPQYLRYYLASKMNSGIDDFDFNVEDFQNRVNSDLVGKITNLASRSAQMLTKKLDGKLTQPDSEGLALIHLAQNKSTEIAKHFEHFDFAKVLNEVRALADQTNRYFDEKSPWKTIKENPAAAQEVITSVLNVFRILAIYLKPIIPAYTLKVSKLFNETDYQWKDLEKILTVHLISPFEHLAERIAPEKAAQLISPPLEPNN